MAHPFTPILIVAGAAVGHYTFSIWPPTPGPTLDTTFLADGDTASVAVPLVFPAAPWWLLAAWQTCIVVLFVQALGPAGLWHRDHRDGPERVGAAALAGALVLTLIIITWPLSAGPSPHWGEGFDDPPGQLEVGGTLTYDDTDWEITHVDVVDLAGFDGVDPALRAGGFITVAAAD